MKTGGCVCASVRVHRSDSFEGLCKDNFPEDRTSRRNLVELLKA